jgi:hypothetical protein
VDILKNYFLNGLSDNPVSVFLSTKDDISAPWFPSLMDFATSLDVGHSTNPRLVDSDFNKLVDIILGGNAKNNLRALNMHYQPISSNGLAVDAARLVEQSQSLRYLGISANPGMLDDQEQVQLLCNKLKKNKSLRTLDLSACNASKGTANAITTMMVDMLQVNTTLTDLDLHQTYNRRRENNINFEIDSSHGSHAIDDSARFLPACKS